MNQRVVKKDKCNKKVLHWHTHGINKNYSILPIKPITQFLLQTFTAPFSHPQPEKLSFPKFFIGSKSDDLASTPLSFLHNGKTRKTQGSESAWQLYIILM